MRRRSYAYQRDVSGVYLAWPLQRDHSPPLHLWSTSDTAFIAAFIAALYATVQLNRVRPANTGPEVITRALMQAADQRVPRTRPKAEDHLNLSAVLGGDSSTRPVVFMFVFFF